MPDLKIDPSRTALLLMDFQESTLGYLPDMHQSGLVERTRQALEASRRAGVFVAYSARMYREGYPEVHPRDTGLLKKKAAGERREGSTSAAMIKELAPLPEEPIFPKRRTSAFMHNDLDLVLRCRGIEIIVLAGISTSGAVLSTVRIAADLDYGLIVLEDCCGDKNDEVHRVLVKHIFPVHAAITTSQGYVKTLGTR